MKTPIHKMQLNLNENHLFIKRDDLMPFSFGGNKYRKALHYFKQIDDENYNVVITTGSASSNHCRIVANMARQRAIECIIISPKELEKNALNRTLTHWLDADVRVVPQTAMSDTIKTLIKEKQLEGKKPYYIKMGGHGYLGTKAYVEAYQEILDYAEHHNISFDYLFFADGTGTTHAGLLAGKICQNKPTEIIGIGVLNDSATAKPVIYERVNEYLKNHGYATIKADSINYEDAYLMGGYGHDNQAIRDVIKATMQSEGIPLDPVYTGKGFYGMIETIKRRGIKGKNILFIHTGGAPIFFDLLNQENDKTI